VKDVNSVQGREVSMDVSNLTSGYYLLKITTADDRQLIRGFIRK
jgi:hypothetical protein